MSEITTFESRKGKVNCSSEELYRFLTDIRNFERFIPAGKFSDLIIERESCSFNVNMMGKVTIRLGNSFPYSEVTYTGRAMQLNDFSLKSGISEIDPEHSEVRLVFTAEMNPFLKMLASEPVNRLLDTLVAEMEKFSGWKDIRRDI